MRQTRDAVARLGVAREQLPRRRLLLAVAHRSLPDVLGASPMMAAFSVGAERLLGSRWAMVAVLTRVVFTFGWWRLRG